MKTIILAGGSGLIGTAIAEHLTAIGSYDIRILSRQPEEVKEYEAYYWDPLKGEIDDGVFAEADVIINLAGSNIASKRWTHKRKQLIIDSRRASNLILKPYLENSPSLQKYIAASAQGFYGDHGDTLITESAEPSKRGFQSTSTIQWEKAIRQTIPEGMNYCIMRNSVVLSVKGGPLKELKPFAGYGIVPRFGTGKQYLSWIHINDIVRIYQQCIERPDYRGIINVVAGSVSYSAFAEAIRKAFNCKLPSIPAPAFLLKIGMGQMSEMVLESTRLSPEKLKSLGYNFLFTDINKAVKDIYSHER